MKHIYLFLLITVLSISAFSQTQNCTIILNRAEDDYAAGRLLGIEGQITPCLVNESFSKEEEIRALKLLTLVFIFTDNDTKADEYLVRLLKADPEHDLDPEVDPAELYYLYNQFRVKPIFRLAFRAGINISSPQIVNSFSTSNTNDWPKFTNGRTPSGQTIYQVGEQDVAARNGIGIGTFLELMIERHLLNGIEVAGGPQLRISSYNVDMYHNVASIYAEITEQQTYLRLPILARYNLWYEDEPRKPILPYGYLGCSFDYLLNSTVSEGARTGGTSFSLVSNNDYKANEMVYNTNFSVFGGLGAKFRISRVHFLTVEARYDRSFGLYNNPENRWNNNQNSTFDLGYVQDDTKLHLFSFSVGYTQSIYNPKKFTE